MNFQEFEMQVFSRELLVEMYNMPSKQLPTNRIVEILCKVTGKPLDHAMVSAIFNHEGLSLRERPRVSPKPAEVRPKRVTKAEILEDLYSQLDTSSVNGETEPNLFIGEEIDEHHPFEDDYAEQENGVYVEN